MIKFGSKWLWVAFVMLIISGTIVFADAICKNNICIEVREVSQLEVIIMNAIKSLFIVTPNPVVQNTQATETAGFTIDTYHCSGFDTGTNWQCDWTIPGWGVAHSGIAHASCKSGCSISMSCTLNSMPTLGSYSVHMFGWCDVSGSSSSPPWNDYSSFTVIAPPCGDTCSSLGYSCGTATICGVTQNCGNCISGWTCNNHQCQQSCTDTCSSLGYNCGSPTICGSIVNCGNCPSGQTCTNFHCQQQCSTCASLGKQCGTGWYDNCGNYLNCGTCLSGQTCSAGTCVQSCTQTCGSLGYNCGSFTPSGCPTLNCGNCPSGQTCSGNHCSCTGSCVGKNCGDNGCGVSCGTCQSGYTCGSDGVCKSNTCTESWSCSGFGTCTSVNGVCSQVQTCHDDNNCGTQVNMPQLTQPCDCGCIPNCINKVCGDNSCGGTCGTCPTGQTCSAGGTTCITQCDTPKTCDSYITSSGYPCGEKSDGCTGTIQCTCPTGQGYTCSSGSCVKGQVSTCTENWQTGSWSTCTSNVQTRTATDLNKCGTANNKPTISKGCTVTGTGSQQVTYTTITNSSGTFYACSNGSIVTDYAKCNSSSGNIISDFFNFIVSLIKKIISFISNIGK
jgi:hypothetical protein